MKPQETFSSYSLSSNDLINGAVSSAEKVYGQSVFDILLTKFLDKSNFYVDSINLTEWHMYGSSRLGIYSTTLNLAWQRFQASVTNGQYASITNTVLVVNEPSYNFFYLTRGKKRYELSNHLGNVLAVISDMKLYACHQYDKFVNFEDNPNILGDWNIRDSWEGQNAVISLANGKLNVVDQITADPHARVNYITASHLPPDQTYKISFDLEQINGDPNWQIGIVTANSSTTYEANFTFFSASPGHNEITVHPSKHIWRIRLLHLQTAQDIEFNIDNFRIENLSIDTFTSQMADIVSATDYSPFGAPLPGRTLVTKEYRFRFNGKESDNETFGDGNTYDYGLRVFDPRIARFLSVDPLEKEYPWNSTFSYAEDNPIKFVDLDGAERAYKKPDGTFVTPGDHFYSPMPKVAQKQFLVDGHPDMILENLMTTAVITGPLALATGTEQILWHTYSIAMRMSPILTSSALVASRYGSDVANFIYGFSTDDQKEPFPGSFQSSDAGIVAKRLFSGVGGQVLDRTLNKVKEISKKMDIERIDDAMRNLQGEFLKYTNPAIKKFGQNIDHLQSLQNQINGLNNQINGLKQALKDKIFTDEQAKFANDLIEKITEKVTVIKDQMDKVKTTN